MWFLVWFVVIFFMVMFISLSMAGLEDRENTLDHENNKIVD